MLYVNIIIMKAHHIVKLFLIACLTSTIQSFLACSSNCTATTANAFCTSQGYCTCKPGFVFNCSTPATVATSNSFLTPLTNARPYFYILSAQIGTELEYTLTFSDVNIADIYITYQPRILIDDGMGAPPFYVGGFCTPKPFYLVCNFKVTLYNQLNTDLPESLIMMINMTIPFVSPALSFSYSYTAKTTNTPIFLILGYVAGGLLILISIVLIVVVYRKKGQINRRYAESKAEPVVFDISHFQEFMPAGLITVEDKKNIVACSVCLQEFDFNTTVRRTVCQHVFHTTCLDEWCMKNLSCPMCRTAFNRENLEVMKTERSKRDSQTDWIMNSMVLQQEEVSEIRNPLTGSVMNNDDAL